MSGGGLSHNGRRQCPDFFAEKQTPGEEIRRAFAVRSCRLQAGATVDGDRAWLRAELLRRHRAVVPCAGGLPRAACAINGAHARQRAVLTPVAKKAPIHSSTP